MKNPPMCEEDPNAGRGEKYSKKGRCTMANSVPIRARDCCSKEKKRLKKNLDRCDAWTSTAYARHRCYQSAARESGERSRQCVIEQA